MNINLNEGGRFITLYVNTSRRMARLWFKPNFWRIGKPLFERRWVW
jgi:hypothetical protein